MIYKEFKDGVKLSTLGLGNMRLPALHPGDPKSPIDWPQSHEMMAYAMAQGITYYDTAYVYNSGESEECLGAGMKKFPRDSFNFATKWHMSANPDYKDVFETQLKRLQTDHIDFYLIHCVMDNCIDDYLASGGIEYFLEQQKAGKIRYLGFSSHGSPATLERFASHHQWDFAQIQLNYYDWNYSTAKEEYEILKAKNIPIVVMEPVRGGRLSQLTPDAEAILKAAHPDWSISSWALRFVRSLSQVQVILSGMSNMDQLKDNLKTFDDPCTLSDEDQETLKKACDMFHSQLVVPCTGCRYCTEGCPMGINIPEFLKVYNNYKVNGPHRLREIESIVSDGQPSDCIGCGACTGICPQTLQVPQYMTELAEAIEKFKQ